MVEQNNFQNNNQPDVSMLDKQVMWATSNTNLREQQGRERGNGQGTTKFNVTKTRNVFFPDSPFLALSSRRHPSIQRQQWQTLAQLQMALPIWFDSTTWLKPWNWSASVGVLLCNLGKPKAIHRKQSWKVESSILRTNIDQLGNFFRLLFFCLSGNWC